jgi:hypothetical protein
MQCRILELTLALLASVMSFPSQAALIQAGTPITNNADVHTYLNDGFSYLPFPVDVVLGTDQFLLPVEITGAAGLQTFDFALNFNSAVVQVLSIDYTQGVYGAEFTSGDLTTLSYILAGFPLTGEVDVGGSYPGLLSGPSGNGVLAFILFQYQTGQSGNDPGFGVSGTQVTQVPEPGSLALLGGLLAIGGWFTHRSRPG